MAQSALPGDPLYGWKRTSEQVWRSLSPDQIGADLTIVHRRTDELLTVTSAEHINEAAGAASQQATAEVAPGGAQLPTTGHLPPGGAQSLAEGQAVQRLHEALNNLKASPDKPVDAQRIEKVLKSQQKALSDAGIKDETLDDLLGGLP
jgi:hypothetical protein